jgi:hypothetical protein
VLSAWRSPTMSMFNVSELYIRLFHTVKQILRLWGAFHNLLPVDGKINCWRRFSMCMMGRK